MKHELLVPVGSFKALIAAINNGADAVYLGGKKFGARAYAENFSLEEIEKSTKMCHLYGVKIYITVNTLIYESEFSEVVSYVKELHKIGVDALIMQDIGLINVVHQILPNLEIHASTQMHNNSSEVVPFLEKLGIKRIVFARELSLSYINNIKTELEKEVFIHGSLCISYSGQCLFSSAILCRSGNRGECAGMCRLPYQIYENGKALKTNGDYILSPKDLCTVDKFKELMESNIKCFKIEGRMKSPEYVGIVTKIYRTLMNQYENGKKLEVNAEDMTLLKAIFNRDYTEGFLFNDNDILNNIRPNHMGIYIGKVTSVTRRNIGITLDYPLEQFSGIRFRESNIGLTVNFLYNAKNELINKGKTSETIYLDNTFNLKTKDEVYLTMPNYHEKDFVEKRIVINIFLEALTNRQLKIKVSDGENVVILTGQVVEKAKNSPLSQERIKETLQKCGNTPFEAQNIEIKMDENIFIPISFLNEIRRNALIELQSIRENKKVKYIEKEYQENKIVQVITHNINVLVRTKEQLKACLDSGNINIIVKNSLLMNDNYTYQVPRGVINHNYSYQKLLVTDIGSMEKYPHNLIDYHLNITNHYTLEYLSNYGTSSCLSVECTLDNIKNIMSKVKDVNVEAYIYGNIELMLMKYCPIQKFANHDKKCNACLNNDYYLKDRNNAYYKLETNRDSHHTSILNATKTDLISKIPYLKSLGVTNYRVELLDESYDETMKLIERVKSYE